MEYRNHEEMPEYSVRLAHLSDADAIAALMEQLGYTITPEEIRGKLPAFRMQGRDEVFVVERQGRVLGCVSCHLTHLLHRPGSSGRITSLVVGRESRGGGMGAGLLSAAETWFRQKGCLRCEVTSGEQREDAHRFYRRQGYRQEALRFVKDLTEEASAPREARTGLSLGTPHVAGEKLS